MVILSAFIYQLEELHRRMIHSYISTLLLTNYSNETNIFLIPLSIATIQLALIISTLCIVFGTPLLRKISSILIIYTGFFFVTSHTVNIAYGITAPVNIFYMPIPKIPEATLALCFYLLYLSLIMMIFVYLRRFIKSIPHHTLHISKTTKAHD